MKIHGYVIYIFESNDHINTINIPICKSLNFKSNI